MDIREKIKELPSSCGVYIMKDGDGNVLYVGKADNLRKRVLSYFRSPRRLSGRLAVLVEKVKEITHIPTSTSAEALIYENGLIKQLAPKYNVALKDDKSYPMLKLTVNEKFPRLFITREKKDDGALYYGPYTSAKLLRQASDFLHRLFLLRVCNRMPKKLCLDYRLSQCMGPCEGKVDEKSYNEAVAELRLFLEGRMPELVKTLSEKMAQASREERFEEAALLRNRIEALSAVREKKVAYTIPDELEELKRLIDIKGKIETIEAFDISNIMGKEAVGSMVTFLKGRPKKAGYRLFRIKTVSGIDDYAMMREIVRRRYRRLAEEGKGFPDLIVIDGGKGHLGVAARELEKLELGFIPVIGIAKEFEHIYVKGKSDPLILPQESKALHLIMRIRDEAHRFAIKYHKNLLSKKARASELDPVPDIGPKRRRGLLKAFGSIEKIRSATLEELLKAEGMNEKAAKSIIDYFKR